MLSDGGATLGYCSIGSDRSASNPAIEIISATTQAKTGRSMKKAGPTGDTG